MIPHRSNTDRQNIKYAGPIANAAYKGKRAKRGNLKSQLSDKGIELHEWEKDNAFGIWFLAGDDLHIAIAGTDDKRDAAQDAAVLSQELQQSDLPVSDDARGVRTTAGFLGHTESAHSALAESLQPMLAKPVANIWLYGHSLGGAIAYLLACTKPFSTANVITFGAARPVRKLSYAPNRLLIRVEHIADPFPSLPPQCKHPKSRVFYRTSRFTPARETIPLFPHLPLAIAYKVLFYATGLACSCFRMVGVKVGHNLFKGHDMDDYAA